MPDADTAFWGKPHRLHPGVRSVSICRIRSLVSAQNQPVNAPEFLPKYVLKRMELEQVKVDVPVYGLHGSSLTAQADRQCRALAPSPSHLSPAFKWAQRLKNPGLFCRLSAPVDNAYASVAGGQHAHQKPHCYLTTQERRVRSRLSNWVCRRHPVEPYKVKCSDRKLACQQRLSSVSALRWRFATHYPAPRVEVPPAPPDR